MHHESKKEEMCSLVLFESEQHYFLFTFRVVCLSHSFLDRRNILLLPEMLHFTDLQGRDWVCCTDWSLSKYFDVSFQKKEDLGKYSGINKLLFYFHRSMQSQNERGWGSLWRLPGPNPSFHSRENSNRWLNCVHSVLNT